MKQGSAWFLAGATATGKTAVAQWIAERTGAVVVSADAMLVYRGMDLGTAKPTPEERKRVVYYGLDCVSPAESFNTAAWLRAVSSAWHEEAHRSAPEPGQGVIVTGGTGLYLKALALGLDETPALDPALRARIAALFETGGVAALQEALRREGAEPEQVLSDPQNPRRLMRALEILKSSGTLPVRWKNAAEIKPAFPVLRFPRAALHARIARRVGQMYAQGLLEETVVLTRDYPVWSATASAAIGYAEALAVLNGEMAEPSAREKTVIRTRQLARRQETWLRHQADPGWLDCSPEETTEEIAARVLAHWSRHGATPVTLA